MYHSYPTSYGFLYTLWYNGAQYHIPIKATICKRERMKSQRWKDDKAEKSVEVCEYWFWLNIKKQQYYEVHNK